MTKEMYNELIQREHWFGKLESEYEYYKHLTDQLMRDEKVRMNNPSVQKAYEKYKALLELSRT